MSTLRYSNWLTSDTERSHRGGIASSGGTLYSEASWEDSSEREYISTKYTFNITSIVLGGRMSVQAISFAADI